MRQVVRPSKEGGSQSVTVRLRFEADVDQNVGVQERSAVKSFDWLTIVLAGLGVLMLAAARFMGPRPVVMSGPYGRPTRPSPVKGGLALIGAALLLQFFRGFDVPVQGVEFHSHDGSVVVTGTLENPHSFKLNAIVVDVSAMSAEGTIIVTQKVVVKEILPRSSSRFTATLKTTATVARVQVAAEGFWT
jgi:hypothetical protein